MAKVAENERIKLRANFYNNASVSCLIAGVLLPFFTLLPKLAEFGGWTRAWMNGHAEVNENQLVFGLAIVAGMIGALYYAWSFRRQADREISKIR